MQKKISQRWRIPRQTVNSVLKDFERKEMNEHLNLKQAGQKPSAAKQFLRKDAERSSKTNA